jgi:hypothetical protein
MKPIPRALFSCAICAEDYSWPAEDLFWNKATAEWICLECWYDNAMGDKGISLAEEIENQKGAE